MQFLRNLVEKQRKLYHSPDAKLHKFWPLFDAGETFLFNPDTKTPDQGPQVRDYVDLKRVMMTVIFALLPCLLWSIWNTGAQHFAAIAGMGVEGYTSGWLQGLFFGEGYAPLGTATDKIVFGLQQMLPIIICSYAVGLGIEGMFSVWRKEEVSEGYLVSGILIALIVPPSIPLWQLALSVAFSVILVKEVFGGTGMNVFNVALMSRAFLFFAYPAQISGDFVWVAGNGPTKLIDGYSAPTPLALGSAYSMPEGENLPVGESVVANVGDHLHATYSWSDMFWGNIPGSVGEMSSFCILLGAALLIITGIGSWRTMFAGVIGIFAGAFILNLFNYGGLFSLSGMDHLVMGGFLFGIVFMATDPVTCPETNRGKWIYGFLIGILAALVRVVNPAYPEGTMLAILLMNAFAPTIDYFVTQANVRRRRKRLG
ncbi:MAG: NADH:ubiquinone reductase (Na(+)-transporting) subunit B [Planctomycetota bacterium]|jgi:Na+-transporting NADH:ubiquinone oxidoreductase subunit B